MNSNYQTLFLKLSRVDLSFQKFSALLRSDVDLSTLCDANESQLQKMGFTKRQIQKWQAYAESDKEKDLIWLAEPENHLVTVVDATYPALLKTIYDPPLVLYIKGDPSLLNNTQVAVVGSRNPSKMGADIAYDFAEHLAKLDIVITSGMATGIDAASHQGALAVKGKTIAVCGTGLDRVYPARHHKLAKSIAAKGALVSEFPLGTLPRPYHFPKRNRIISGLSLGCLVVEAAIQSGSLITAKQALEQGREVFAVPGSIHNPLARGCHHLIRQGAKLVETADDILEELQFVRVEQPEPLSLENPQCAPILDKEHHKLLECIGFETTAVDVIVAHSGLSVCEVTSMLLNLELNLHVSAKAGGYVRTKG